MERRPRIGIFGGLAVAVGGFALITAAWNGAASQGQIEGQFPFLLSGGVTGLALVIVGLAVLVVNQVKAEGDERARQMDDLIATVEELAARLGCESASEYGGEYSDPSAQTSALLSTKQSAYRTRPRVPDPPGSSPFGPGRSSYGSL
jgi:hypothetical protein